ncbi:MAG: hypothetical protein AB9891_21155 [Anaerolineaceae bacterium]
MPPPGSLPRTAIRVSRKTVNHGIPLLTVSYILGHSQPSTTLNMYGHQFSAMELQAACLVDDIFAKAQPSALPAEFLKASKLKE